MDPEKRFLKAISFCLSRDGYGGDAEALARWALAGEGEEPSPEDRGLKVALVSGGATKIKDYVFESSRLPEIRGASELLDRINTEDVPRLWEEPEPTGIGRKECVIYAGGGEVLAFAPVCKAQWLVDEVERLYAHETMVAQSVAVWQAFELRQLRDGLFADGGVSQAEIERLLGYNPARRGGFGSLILPLTAARYRRREGNTEGGRALRNVAHVETVPFARRCSSCELRAAVVNARVGDDDDRPLCEPCARKRVFGQLMKREGADLSWWDRAKFHWQPGRRGGQSWATRFEDWLEAVGDSKLRSEYAVGEDGMPLISVRVPEAVRDIGEIAQASSPQGFVGFVYADGNDMGRLLEALQTPSDYAIFAKEVSEALREATFSALAKHLRPVQVLREGRSGQVLVHPFEILNIGGDDLLLVVPAHAALPLACDIALGVEGKLPGADPGRFRVDRGYTWSGVQRCRGDSPDSQSKVSLSAGVIIADAHTPIFYLQELAGQLLKSAKSRAKWLKQNGDYFGGTVDFLSLKSVTTLSGTVRQFRETALTKEGGRHYARPYTLGEVRALVETVKLLKAAKFPRGQLYRLRESLKAGVLPGTVDYRYFLSRGELDAPRRKIEELWAAAVGSLHASPWRERLEQKGALETIWADVAEIYDFVPGEEGAHAGSQD